MDTEKPSASKIAVQSSWLTSEIVDQQELVAIAWLCRVQAHFTHSSLSPAFDSCPIGFGPASCLRGIRRLQNHADAIFRAVYAAARASTCGVACSAVKLSLRSAFSQVTAQLRHAGRARGP